MYYSVLQMERGTIKLPEPAYDHHNERRKELGLTWEQYLNNRTSDHHDRMLEANERQAEALETIAGMMMMRFEYDDDMPSYSTEAMLEEAHHYASGGELQL